MQPALIALTVFSIVLFLITKPLGLWLTPLAKGRAPPRRDRVCPAPLQGGRPPVPGRRTR